MYRIWYGTEVIGMSDRPADLLRKMPDTFRFSEALEHINKRQFYNLLDDGRITLIARGLYRKSDWHGDEDLIEIASASPRATIALRSALARHNLIDDIPDMLDIALPRGTWAPRTTTPVRWHRFDPDTFDIGREALDIGAGKEIGVYSAPRSIIDAYRLQHHEGIDLANDALKQWLRQGGQPSELLRMGRAFPHAQRALQQTLSILL
jgi:predicted transcriptional regulator of viral defense system